MSKFFQALLCIFGVHDWVMDDEHRKKLARVGLPTPNWCLSCGKKQS